MESIDLFLRESPEMPTRQSHHRDDEDKPPLLLEKAQERMRTEPTLKKQPCSIGPSSVELGPTFYFKTDLLLKFLLFVV